MYMKLRISIVILSLVAMTMPEIALQHFYFHNQGTFPHTYIAHSRNSFACPTVTAEVL